MILKSALFLIQVKRVLFFIRKKMLHTSEINPLNAELNPICHLLELLAHHILHVSRVRVK